MVQTAEHWCGHHRLLRRIDGPRLRTVVVEALVRSTHVIVAVDILSQDSVEMALAKNDAVIQALASQSNLASAMSRLFSRSSLSPVWTCRST